MFKKIGHRYIAFDAANEGGAGGGAGEHPVVAPWAGAGDQPWALGEGDAAKPWWNTIPEQDARSHIEAKGYKNPAELALAHLNLTRLHSGAPNVIGLPGADATPEQLNEFYTKLGRPESPDKYEFKFGEGVQADEGLVNFARSTFHEAGLTPQQAQVVADKWNAYMEEQGTQFATQFAEQNNQEMTELATRWGADLERNKAAGQRVIQALGLTEDLAARVESHIGAAALTELLATIGRKTDEGSFKGGSGQMDPNNPASMNAQQAAQRITQLQGDAEFQKKYTDRNHPGHADALKLMEQLFARA